MKMQLVYGDKVGEFTYIGEAPTIILPSGQKPRRIFCKCQCGNIISSLLSHVNHKKTKTCGECKSSKLDKNEEKSPLYGTWRSMRNRCSPSYFQRKYYYDKGITVFNEWNLYSNFKKWALSNGYKNGLQIDRIYNSLGYFPENCRFVTQVVNLSNRDITKKVVYKGKLTPLMTLLHLRKISAYQSNTITRRIKRGWSVEDAIDIPIKKGNYGKLKTNSSE